MAEPFNFWGAVLDFSVGNVIGGIAKVGAAMIPQHWKKEISARGDRLNPLRTISGNHDLVRGIRISWIRAATFIIDDVRKAIPSEPQDMREPTLAFIDDLERRLAAIRTAAFRTHDVVGSTPIDNHVQAVLNGTPEFVRPHESTNLDAPVTTTFVATIAEVMKCPLGDVPPTLGRIASGGRGRTDSRTFGELVYADFAEMLKNPKRYPEAKEAFHIAMSGAIKSLGESCLDIMKGVDETLDLVLARLDGLDALGAVDYRPYFEKLQAGIEGVQETVDAGFAESRVRDQHLLDNAKWLKEQWEAFVAHHGSTGPLAAGSLEDRALATIAELMANERYREASRVATDALARGPRQLEEGAALRLLKAGADADASGGDPAGAARRIRQYVMERSGNPDAYHLGLLGMIDEFEAQGKERGLMSDITVAAETAKLAVQEARNQGERLALLIRLGNLLSELGARSANPAALHESISTFTIAAQIADGMGSDFNRAVVRMNLGGVRRILGERAEDEAALGQSAEELRFAAALFHEQSEQWHWAGSQLNLGNGLVAIGALRNDREALRDAVSAYEGALHVYNPGTAPYEWGMAKSAVGRTLDQLARGDTDDESRKARLRLAIAAHRDALTVTSRAHDRLYWAGCQTNLANSVGLLARYERSLPLFQEALALQEQALEEYLPDRDAFRWALCKVNLARTLHGIGIATNSVDWLVRGRDACFAGLQSFRAAGEVAQVQWAQTVLEAIEGSIAEGQTVH